MMRGPAGFFGSLKRSAARGALFCAIINVINIWGGLRVFRRFDAFLAKNRTSDKHFNKIKKKYIHFF